MMTHLTQDWVTTSRRTLALGFVLAALLAASLLLAAKPAHAAMTFAVDRTDDPDPITANACTEAPNDCSLRGAIVAANVATGADDITLPAGTFTLTREHGGFVDTASTGDLDVTGELTITGAGARATSVAGGPAPFEDRIFDNQLGAKTTITGLTITGGNPGGYGGGGVRNQGDLTLDGVAVEDNTALTGGGIESRDGDLTLDKATVKGNTSTGYSGGIYSEKGTLNITDSTVSGNSAAELIGGVSHYSGTANITNSTISGNQTAQAGGGVVAASAVMNVRNSTIASNKSNGLGGGIMTLGPASTVIVKNTIVAGNSLVNCGDFGQAGGVIFSQGNNISSDDSCDFTESTDKQNTNPRLGPLQDNGGPTDTHALLKGSPAVDAGANTGCPTHDQRGVVRKDGDGNGTIVCDIGAFESNDLTPPKVKQVVPAEDATGVGTGVNVSAFFSEAMRSGSINSNTVKLFRAGTTTALDSAVTYEASTNKATLNPEANLQRGARYKAVVTTGAKDLAGNRLDQDPSLTGNQQKAWFFTVRN